MRPYRFGLFGTGVTLFTVFAVAACGSAADPQEEPTQSGSPTNTEAPGAFSDSDLPPATDEPASSSPSSANDQQGQSCPAAGQTQKCYLGDPAQAGIGSCTWGTQTCEGNGEFAQWGPCTGSGSPTPAACDGVDHLCNGKPDDSCTCTPGSKISCYTGPKGTQNVGTCRAGTQVCNADGHGYGPCTGEVTPTAEVCGDNSDHSCNGAAGCADLACSSNASCVETRKTYCNAAGSFQVTGVRFRAASVFPVSVCSGQGSQCGSLTTGGTFTANCAGTYQVCARVPTTRGCDIAQNLCVAVNVPSDGATVSLPPMPGFGPVSTSCVSDCFLNRANMSVSLDVTGQTADGVTVSKANAATSINPTTCVIGGDNGGGGGGGF